ncbi:MAG: V4R domain-containing protein [Candidatus Odinarchaeota archaeon]
MYKRLKKELQINIEDKDGHLFLGEKRKDIRLVMLRPNEILEFAEFAGANADDILIWVGKTLGKSLMEKYFYEKDWSTENMATKKEVVLGVLESLILMGYGALTGTFKKDHVIVNVYESLASEEKENIMAKNLCLLYLGIFNGIFEVLGIDVEGKEVECILTGGDKCSFKFDFIGEEIDDKLVDEELSDQAVSDFLASL